MFNIFFTILLVCVNIFFCCRDIGILDKNCSNRPLYIGSIKMDKIKLGLLDVEENLKQHDNLKILNSKESTAYLQRKASFTPLLIFYSNICLQLDHQLFSSFKPTFRYRLKNSFILPQHRIHSNIYLNCSPFSVFPRYLMHYEFTPTLLGNKNREPSRKKNQTNKRKCRLKYRSKMLIESADI